MRSPRLALAAAMLFFADFASAQTLGPAEYRDRLAAAVAKATGQPTIVVDERTFKGKTPSGEEMTFFADNTYAEYLKNPSRLEEILQRFAAVLPSTNDGSASIDQLVVIVRPSDYLSQVLPKGAPLDNFIPARPMAGDLSLFSVDSPEAIRTANKDDLKRWALTEDGAWARATANIKQRVGPLTTFAYGDQGGAAGYSADSGLAPSILADPAVCGTDKPTGIDKQVVLLITRDAILFAPANDRELTNRFWIFVEQEEAGQRALSSTPLTCQAGKWVVATKP